MEFPDPTPGPGEAVIEIKASGMCGGDLKMYRAKGGAAALSLVGDGSPWSRDTNLAASLWPLAKVCR